MARDARRWQHLGTHATAAWPAGVSFLSRTGALPCIHSRGSAFNGRHHGWSVSSKAPATSILAHRALLVPCVHCCGNTGPQWEAGCVGVWKWGPVSQSFCFRLPAQLRVPLMQTDAAHWYGGRRSGTIPRDTRFAAAPALMPPTEQGGSGGTGSSRFSTCFSGSTLALCRTTCKHGEGGRSQRPQHGGYCRYPSQIILLLQVC